MKTSNPTAKAVLAAATALLAAVSAQATLALNQSNDLGTIVPNSPSGDADEISYVTTLLGLTPGGTAQVNGGNVNNPKWNTITRSLVIDPGSKTVGTFAKVNASGPYLIDNFEYVFAKYGGGQSDGGSVVWYTGGAEASIPDSFPDFGGTLSHVAGINPMQDVPPVPEPSTYLAGALLLLPLGASAIRVLRRNREA